MITTLPATQKAPRYALLAAMIGTLLATLLPLGSVAHAQTVDPTIERQTLTSSLITPTAMAIADDGRVIVTSREGQITVWEQDGTITRAAHLPVDAYDRQGGQFDIANCPRGDECPEGYNLAEGGIHGILLAPDFMESGELYLYYSPPFTLGEEITPPKMPGARPHCDGPNCQLKDGANDEGVFRLSRFTLDLQTNELDLDSELQLFENPAEWFFCCHYGGDMAWRNDGTLLLSTGDDTTSDYSNGYSPHDPRPDWTYNSAALTSANVADRRGKILRIDVVDLESGGDGVPGSREGIDPNPFAEDPGADPYVYAMGFRSNYRFGYNAETDHIYVGNVGPDAGSPNAARGPAAHDEIEVVPPGGGTHHGWPYCIANNIPYNRYDFATGTAGQPFDCSGMTPAAIYYTYRTSQTSPYVQMGTGSNTALGGVAYHRPDTGALRLPAHYDDSFFWMEHGRGQVWRVPIKADGNLDSSPASLTPVVPGVPLLGSLSNPIDAAVGPDGAVYLLEGRGFWNSTSGRLSRLACAGCTPDPADYGGGVDVLDVTTDTMIASVDGGLVSSLPTVVTAALAALALALVAVRRRREVL